MKANCWYGKNDVQVVDVPEPKIIPARRGRENYHDRHLRLRSPPL
jgi:hypothetical protein